MDSFIYLSSEHCGIFRSLRLCVDMYMTWLCVGVGLGWHIWNGKMLFSLFFFFAFWVWLMPWCIFGDRRRMSVLKSTHPPHVGRFLGSFLLFLPSATRPDIDPFWFLIVRSILLTLVQQAGSALSSTACIMHYSHTHQEQPTHYAYRFRFIL